MNNPTNRRVSRLLAMSKVEVVLLSAFVGLLAMAALPHFSELSILSDVAAVKRDLKAIGAAMESYRADHGTYPANNSDSPLPGHTTRSEVDQRLLTTPVAYMATMPVDPFRVMGNVGAQYPIPTAYRIYAVSYTTITMYPGYYRSLSKYPKTAWNNWSVGPDWVTNTDGYRPLLRVLTNESGPIPQIGLDRTGNYIAGSGSYYGLRYDPTNGSVSWGDIYWFGGDSADRIN